MNSPMNCKYKVKDCKIQTVKRKLAQNSDKNRLKTCKKTGFPCYEQLKTRLNMLINRLTMRFSVRVYPGKTRKFANI